MWLLSGSTGGDEIGRNAAGRKAFEPSFKQLAKLDNSGGSSGDGEGTGGGGGNGSVSDVARGSGEEGGSSVGDALVAGVEAREDMASCKRRGNELYQQGDFAGAAKAYREAISSTAATDDASSVHSNLALMYLKLGQHGASLEAADACVDANPGWHKGHSRRAEALFELKRHTEAVGAYEAALARLGAADKKEERELRFTLKLAKEAAAGGAWFRQLLTGRDVALNPTSPAEELIFGAAQKSRNFIYLVGDAAARTCYCVDPCWDVEGIRSFALRHRMKLVGCIATHYHIDHVGGLVPRELQAFVLGPFGAQTLAGAGGGRPRIQGFAEMHWEHGCALYCHAAERAKIAEQCALEPDVITPCEEGTRVPLATGAGAADGPSIEVLHTPGHSGGSACFCVRATARGPIQMILSGDTVFPGSCGRLDAPDSSVDSMFDSLRKLRALDDSVRIYPGHAYHGDYTTVGRERVPQAGPWPSGILQPFSHEQFVGMFGTNGGQ